MPQLTVSFDRHSIVCQLIDPPPPELAEPGYLLHLYTPQIKHSFQQLGDITGDGEKQSGVGRDHTRSLQCNYPGQGLCVGFWWLSWWRVHVGAGKSTPNEFLIAAVWCRYSKREPLRPDPRRVVWFCENSTYHNIRAAAERGDWYCYCNTTRWLK